MIANKKCQSYEQANQHKQINQLKGNINAEKKQWVLTTSINTNNNKISNC